MSNDIIAAYGAVMAISAGFYVIRRRSRLRHEQAMCQIEAARAALEPTP